MTREDFRRDTQAFIELVNKRPSMSLIECREATEDLKKRVHLPYMTDLIDICYEQFGSDPEHNKEIIADFQKVFEHCFNPPQMELDDFNFHDPWLREFQIKYLAFYEKYYLSDQNLCQSLIDIVCRRNYQIWNMRREQKRKA